MKPYLLLLLAAVLLAAGCKKDNTDPNGLPKATQDGKNTAGFLVNGQPWLPKASPVGNNPYTVAAAYGPLFRNAHRLSVNMFRYQDADNYQILTIYIAGVRQPGTYQFNQQIDPFVISGPQPSSVKYDVSKPGTDPVFYTGPMARGQVIITRLDTIARVVAGTFEAKLKEDGGPDSLSITQGRFDIKY